MLVRPILVIERQTAQAGAHGALITDLYQDQRLCRQSTPQQECSQVGTLCGRNLKIDTGRHFEWEWLGARYRGRHDLREPPPLLGGMLTRQQVMVLGGDGEIGANSGALQQRPGRVVAIAEPGRSRTALAQPLYHALLLAAQPV